MSFAPAHIDGLHSALSSRLLLEDRFLEDMTVPNTITKRISLNASGETILQGLSVGNLGTELVSHTFHRHDGKAKAIRTGT